jgi:hypothetical protein
MQRPPHMVLKRRHAGAHRARHGESPQRCRWALGEHEGSSRGHDGSRDGDWGAEPPGLVQEGEPSVLWRFSYRRVLRGNEHKLGWYDGRQHERRKEERVHAKHWPL